MIVVETSTYSLHLCMSACKKANSLRIIILNHTKLPQLFLKVPLLILLLVKVPFFNMMSLEMVLAVSRKEAIIWLPAVINIYL